MSLFGQTYYIVGTVLAHAAEHLLCSDEFMTSCKGIYGSTAVKNTVVASMGMLSQYLPDLMNVTHLSFISKIVHSLP